MSDLTPTTCKRRGRKQINDGEALMGTVIVDVPFDDMDAEPGRQETDVFDSFYGVLESWDHDGPVIYADKVEGLSANHRQAMLSFRGTAGREVWGISFRGMTTLIAS